VELPKLLLNCVAVYIVTSCAVVKLPLPLTLNHQIAMPKPQPNDILNAFIKHDPNCHYTFDSERDSPQSELCRKGSGSKGQECIMIQMNSKRLFEAMQELGFFCALPMDPSRTYIECKRLPK